MSYAWSKPSKKTSISREKKLTAKTIRKYEQHTVLHYKWLDEMQISVNGRATES
jgi:hypothetical protein